MKLIRSGYFRKKGRSRKTWKERVYEVFDDGTLTYLTACEAHKMKGSLNLTDAAISWGDPSHCKKSGSLDFSVDESVSLTVSCGPPGHDQRILDVVFDSREEAYVFIKAIMKVGKATNCERFLNDKKWDEVREKEKKAMEAENEVQLEQAKSGNEKTKNSPKVNFFALGQSTAEVIAKRKSSKVNSDQAATAAACISGGSTKLAIIVVVFGIIIAVALKMLK